MSIVDRAFPSPVNNVIPIDGKVKNEEMALSFCSGIKCITNVNKDLAYSFNKLTVPEQDSIFFARKLLFSDNFNSLCTEDKNVFIRPVIVNKVDENFPSKRKVIISDEKIVSAESKINNSEMDNEKNTQLLANKYAMDIKKNSHEQSDFHRKMSQLRTKVSNNIERRNNISDKIGSSNSKVGKKLVALDKINNNLFMSEMDLISRENDKEDKKLEMIRINEEKQKDLSSEKKDKENSLKINKPDVVKKKNARILKPKSNVTQELVKKPRPGYMKPTLSSLAKKVDKK